MKNLYLDNLKNTENHFLEILNSSNSGIPRKTLIASIFHQFKSAINDPSVLESDKSIIINKWEDFYEKANLNKSEQNQVNKYLVEHIINMNNDNYNYNILKHSADSYIEKYYNVIKREINKGNMDVIFSMTRHYSDVYSKGFSFSNFDFEQDTPNFENTITDDNDIPLENLSYNDNVFQKLLSNQTNEDKSNLLNRFIELYNHILDKEEYQDAKYINNFDTIVKEVSSDLDNYDYSPLTEEQKRFHRHNINEFDHEEQIPVQHLNNSLDEINSDFKDDCYQRFLKICKDNNLIQKNKIPLVTSELVVFDPNFEEGEETSKKILKINKITGSLTIPPSSFNDPLSHELSALHARSKGWDTVAIIPPKKGTLNDKKEFMKNAILSMYNIGEYEQSDIQVPKKWEKFKNDIISQLKVDSQIKQKLSQEDMLADNDIDIEPRLENEPKVTPTSDVNETLVENNENSSLINQDNIPLDNQDNIHIPIDKNTGLNATKQEDDVKTDPEEDIYHHVPNEDRKIENDSNVFSDFSITNDFDQSLIDSFNQEGDIPDHPNPEMDNYFHDSFDIPDDISRDFNESIEHLHNNQKKTSKKNKPRNGM